MKPVALNIEQFLLKSQSLPVIDVRSPSEFDHAHIPGAVNLPLFTNEERSVIGTLYLKKGSSEAMKKGFEFIGPKLKEFVETGFKISAGKEMLMHCWRGGMRSNSMAWLMNAAGINTYTLTGGYKAYRQYALKYFSNPAKLIVIGGMTGSGKTELIEALASMSQQTINLEQLARHRGSVFGNIGMSGQPSSEQFENDLFVALTNLDYQKTVFIEDESLAIGKVFIPRDFYNQITSSPIIELLVPIERRVQRLAQLYGNENTGALIAGIRKIERRLGLENAAAAIGHIQNSETNEAVMMVLKYYDKIYRRSMNQHKRSATFEIKSDKKNINEIAEMIIKTANKIYE